MKRKLAKGRAERRCDNCTSTGAAAFTLIELLVVILIIAILAAMLLPSLSRAKAQAKSTVCKNHLHEMGLALEMYLDDDSGNFPNPSALPNTMAVETVFTALYPYYPLRWTNTSYHCPGYKAPITDAFANSPPTGSYAYNNLGTFLPGTPSSALRSEILPGTGLSLGLTVWLPYVGAVHDHDVSYSLITVPSEMFAFGESRLNYFPGVMHYPGVTGTAPLAPAGALGAGMTLAGDVGMFCGGNKYWPAWSYPIRHGRNYNMASCDGHVESIAPAALFDPARTALRWNIDHQPHPKTWVP